MNVGGIIKSIENLLDWEHKTNKRPPSLLNLDFCTLLRVKWYKSVRES